MGGGRCGRRWDGLGVAGGRVREPWGRWVCWGVLGWDEGSCQRALGAAVVPGGVRGGAVLGVVGGFVQWGGGRWRRGWGQRGARGAE